MIKLIVISLGLVFSINLTSCSNTEPNHKNNHPRAEKAEGYKVGDVATDFKLQNVDGKFYALSDLDKVKGYIVVFTSNVCPYAVMYQDRLIELHNKMAPLGYPVVAINSNDASIEEGDSFENMQARASEMEFPFLYLNDADQKIYPKYGATKTPHVFLLDNEMVVKYIGAIDDNAKSPEDVEVKYVENAIDALQKGEEPNPNFTKAIGCPIKSKKARRGRDGRPPRGDRKGPPNAEGIVERMDSDKDGKVSKDEAHGPLKNDFTRLDLNNDGYLTIEELSKLKKRK